MACPQGSTTKVALTRESIGPTVHNRSRCFDPTLGGRSGRRTPRNTRLPSGSEGRSMAAGSDLAEAETHSPVASTSAASRTPVITDPEARYRTYGRHFGKRYTIDLTDMMEGAPQIRVRKAADRQRDQLAELAVLNERLAGNDTVSTRKRVEYIRAKRRNWQAIYDYVTSSDAAATMAMIEEADAQCEAMLSPEMQESVAVGDLRNQLQQLNSQVEKAQERLSLTQARVQQNLERVETLKKEAASLERVRTDGSSTADVVAELSGARAVEFNVATSTVTAAPAEQSALQRSTGSGVAGPSGSTSPKVNRQAVLRRKRGLSSSLELEDGLRNFWYPSAFTKDLVPDKMVPIELFGETWVLFRDEKGAAACVRDECAHRACPLSLGKVVDGRVQCAYHGWEFDGSGKCTTMPSTTHCRGVSVTSLPCVERDGWVWVWPGDLLPTDLPSFGKAPDGFVVHAEIEVEVPVEHGLLIENLLDLAHAPFTHTTTFAKGWPVPDAVKFHASRLLEGQWDPYPIDMAFHPPCMTESMIGLAKPGKLERGATAAACKNHLHQVHVCLPSKHGHTRLLYRMSLDFMGWVGMVPGIQAFWRYIAGQVLGEDLVLVTGQQERMMRGGDTWGFPVSYDKLAVRYRRWRNEVSRAGAHEELPVDGPVAMSAGQLFSIEQEDVAECVADECSATMGGGAAEEEEQGGQQPDDGQQQQNKKK